MMQVGKCVPLRSNLTRQEGITLTRYWMYAALPVKAWVAWETGIPVGYGGRRVISGLKKADGLWPQRTVNKEISIGYSSETTAAEIHNASPLLPYREKSKKG